MASKKKKDYVGTVVSIDKNGEIVRTSPDVINAPVTKVNSNTSNLVSQPTVEAKQTVKMPAMNTQQLANKNYEEKLALFNKATEDLDKKRVEELNKRNIDLTQRLDKQDFRNQVQNGRVVDKRSLEQQQRQYDAFQPKLAELTQAEDQNRLNARNDLRLATYQKNVADVDADNIGIIDKITSPFFSGIGDYFSTVTDETHYVDENGNEMFLPSKNDLKYQKVRESYGDGFLGNLARFGADATHELGKQAATTAVNALTFGKGGTALYYSDIVADQYKQNINEGYSRDKAMGDAVVKGASNYIKQKLIGGLGGKLTGSKDSSWLEKGLTNTFAKYVTNPRVVSFLGSLSSEALDEFTDTYVEAGIDALILGKKINFDDLFKDALYSGAIGGATGGVSGAINVSPDAQQTVYNQQQNRLNQNQNTQLTTQAETPQIQTNTQEQANTQPRLEQTQIELNEANNNTSNTNLSEAIDNKPLVETRTNEDISNKNVNAFQYDNPEVKPFYRDAAYDLKTALDGYTQKGERFMREDGTFGGSKFQSTPEIAELHQDYKMSYDDIQKGINGIIKDEGAENNASSKKVEVVIDKMLRNGYQSETPDTTSPNQDYINTLNGNNAQTNEQVEKELPFATEEEEREYAEKQKQWKEELQNEITQRQTQETENNNIPELKNEDVIKQEITGEEGEQYYKDNGVDDKVAKVLSEKPKKQKTSFKDNLNEAAGETYRLMVSRGGEVEKIAKVTGKQEVKHKYDKSMRARSEAQQHIGKGQADLNYNLYKNFTDKNGNKVNMSLNDIRKDAKNNGISEQDLNEYLAHWLNVDRYQDNKPVFGDSFTDKMSQAEIEKLDAKHPELKRIAENVWTFEHNELKNLYDSGLITENTYNNLAKNEHYVRIQRDVDNGGNKGPIIDRNGRVSVNQTIQKAKGGNQDILPIMESIAEYTTSMIENERMNEAARELSMAIGMGSQGDTINNYETENFGTNPEFVKSNDDGTYTLTYFNKGVATEVPINKALYDAFVKNKAISAIENSKAFKFVTYVPKKISAMFRGLTTNYNPMFLFTNMFKDIGDAPFNSKYMGEFLKTYSSTEALRQVLGDGVYNQLYNRAGGQDDSYFREGNFKDKTQSKFGKITETLATPITKGNEVVETVPRMAEFIATIKANGYEVDNNKNSNTYGELILKDSKKAKGKTSQQVMDEALYNAAEVTTNFKRGGDLAKAINRNGGTFFNASIQGFDKQVRNFKDAFTSGDKRAIVGLLAKAFVFGVAPTMLNDAMHEDDDEYKEMQDYIKDNYYLFKGNDGTWVRIPKGRAMSVIGSAYRRGKDYANGNKDAFKGYATFSLGQVAPNNPIESNIISPFVAVKNNKSWSGNKIISQSMEKKPTDEQFNEKTDYLSRELGKALKDAPIPDNFKSPMGINYLIDQYTGGAGDVLLPWITPKSTSKTSNPVLQPFVSKFTTDSAYSNKNVGTFYDTKDALEKKKNSVNANKMDKLKYSYLNSQNMKLAELYTEQSKIQNDNSLSKTEKYKKAREIQKQINELSKKSVEDLNHIQNRTYYATIGDNTYYLKDNDDGTQSFAKDAHADSHKKSAEKQGMALYDYYKQQYEKRKEKNKK